MSDITVQDVVNPAAGFPYVFVTAITDCIKSWMPNHQVVDRPVRQNDAAAVVGVFPASWADIPGTKEIGHFESVETRYLLKIQVMRKSMDESMGRALFANDSKLVRVMLYRDPLLRVRLGELQETLLESVERVQRFGVARQSFESAELAGAHTFLSVTDYTIDTTITGL